VQGNFKTKEVIHMSPFLQSRAIYYERLSHIERMHRTRSVRKISSKFSCVSFTMHMKQQSEKQKELTKMELPSDTGSKLPQENSSVEKKYVQAEQQQKETEGASVGKKSIWGLPQHAGSSRCARRFTGDKKGLKKSKALTISTESNPMSAVMLYFTAVIPLLVEQTNHYYHEYSDKQDEETSSPLPSITTSEMFLFLVLIIQTGHNTVDSLEDCTMEKFYMPFYSNTVKCTRFLHILCFLHFTDNNEQPNRNEENYDRLWKLKLFLTYCVTPTPDFITYPNI
jgi:hypothetical protein